MIQNGRVGKDTHILRNQTSLKYTLPTPVHLPYKVYLREKLFGDARNFLVLGPLDLTFIFASSVGNFKSRTMMAGRIQEGDWIKIVIIIPPKLHVQS